MLESTETICHWEQVQRQWKWEWASYRPHTDLFWTDATESGATEFLDDATLAPEAPEVKMDLTYGSRWEEVSGSGTNVVIATADLPEGEVPAGDGWRQVQTAGR